MYDYRKYFEDKLKELSKEDSVLDVGGGNPFQKRMAKYKSWFDGKKYETLDFSEKYNPTIVGDIHDLKIGDNSVPAILCSSVLEHLHNPHKAVSEMHRVLSSGGKILAYTHFIYPYHARQGVYGDFYRFTEDALKDLFKDFSTVEIKKEGGYFRAMMFFMPLQSKLKFILEPLAYVLDKLFKTEKRTTTAGYYIYAIK